MPNCPKCGSTRFHYELRAAGISSKTSYYRHRKGNSWLIPSGRRSHSSTRKRVSVGICPDCGYIHEKLTIGDVFDTILGLFILAAIIYGVLYAMGIVK